MVIHNYATLFNRKPPTMKKAKDNKEPMKAINITIDGRTLDRLDVHAGQEKRTRSNMISFIVQNHLDRIEQDASGL
jgi:hypothetical protein